jgi:hypothetical protein
MSPNDSADRLDIVLVGVIPTYRTAAAGVAPAAGGVILVILPKLFLMDGFETGVGKLI